MSTDIPSQLGSSMFRGGLVEGSNGELKEEKYHPLLICVCSEIWDGDPERW